MAAAAERRSEWGLAARGAQSGRDPTTASFRAALPMMAVGGIGVSRRRTEPPEGLAFRATARRLRFPPKCVRKMWPRKRTKAISATHPLRKASAFRPYALEALLEGVCATHFGGKRWRQLISGTQNGWERCWNHSVAKAVVWRGGAWPPVTDCFEGDTTALGSKEGGTDCMRVLRSRTKQAIGGSE